MWKIIPLDVGSCFSDKSDLVNGKGKGEKVPNHFIAWLVTDGKQNIVVDTGVLDQEFCDKYHPGMKPTISEDQKISNALKKHGVDAAEVELVLLTHLHWDHAAGLEYFPKATFIVSQEELGYAINPAPFNYGAYDAPVLGRTPAYVKVLSQLKLIPMEETEIVPGITMIPTPGHSPGSMSVVVETTDGPYVIAGDAVCCYENLEGVPSLKMPYQLSGLFVDGRAMYDSLGYIMKKAGGKVERVFPGHDPKVLEQKCYPVE